MMLGLLDGLLRRMRAEWVRMRGAQIDGHVWLKAIEIPRNHFDIMLKDGVALDRGVTLLATGDRQSAPRITIGENVYINRHTMIDASERIEIGRDVMIGPFCYITDHDHGTRAGVPIREQPLTSAPVFVDAGAWLGANVTVLKGVRIGAGAVVGAGSVVTRDVMPGSIVVGTPARQVGERSPLYNE